MNALKVASILDRIVYTVVAMIQFAATTVIIQLLHVLTLALASKIVRLGVKTVRVAFVLVRILPTVLILLVAKTKSTRSILLVYSLVKQVIFFALSCVLDNSMKTLWSVLVKKVVRMDAHVQIMNVKLRLQLKCLAQHQKFGQRSQQAVHHTNNFRR